MQATITLKYDSAEIAAAIAKAISPDNAIAPAGLTVKTLQQNMSVVTSIVQKGKLATFVATIDDLLACASAAERALRAVKRT